VHPYLRLHLRLSPVEGPGEPDLPAALVRRVLGKALIDGYCPFGKPLCQASESERGERPRPQDLCGLAEPCPYGVLFAASLSRRPPFAIHVAREEKGPGRRLELTLAGPAWRFYPWGVAALARAFDLGLAKERRRWRVEGVSRLRPDRGEEALCGADLTRLPATLAPDALGLGLEPFLAPQPVEVRLLSPARLLHEGRLLPGRTPVPFAVLVARVLDRFAGLFGEGASEILRPGIRATVEAEAARVPLLVDETGWVEVKDYSARSGAEMLLGGKVGRLVYGPEAVRFFPILWAGEILHVGKNTTSGCGRMEVALGEAGR
jgi:hypothetical protein